MDKQWHTVTNNGIHAITVVMKGQKHNEYCVVDPGKSVSGVVLQVIHGNHRAQYKVEPTHD